MRMIYLAAGFIFCTFSAPALEPAGTSRPPPSPVRDLDEPHPVAVPQDAVGRRELACFLFKSSGGQTAHVRAAYEMMRSAARLGDREAPLYLAKFLRADFAVPPNAGTAQSLLKTYLAWLLDGATNTYDRMDRLRTVAQKLSNNECGPASGISLGEIERAAPPPGLAGLRPQQTTFGPTGYLSAPAGPDSDRAIEETRADITASSAREKACAVYRAAGNDQRQRLRAYLLMRTAADCGDEAAAVYVSSFLRHGYGADRNSDLARAYLYRVVRNSRIHDRTDFNAAAALTQGDCSPVDPEGAAMIGRAYLTPAG
jgi:hypothetical protein